MNIINASVLKLKAIYLSTFLLFCLIGIKSFAQSNYKVIISSTSCCSTFETWVNERQFDMIYMDFRKDTTVFINKNSYKTLLNEQNFIADSAENRIDIRVKVVVYKRNKIQKIIYLDTSGDIKINKKFYMKNDSLIAFVKENITKVYCCCFCEY